jgi:hypothetical protein
VEEDLYFKAIIATGETGQHPLTLFYSSPSDYERHWGTQLDVPTKEKWNAKNLEARLRKQQTQKKK